MRQPLEPVWFSIGAERSPWRGITASSRASRSGRSRTVSGGRRRRSRRTSMTRPARRPERSRRATSACAAAAPPTRSHVTARATPTRTATGVPPGRDPAPLDSRASARRDARLARRYGPLPSSYDWSPTHARRRGGEALRRLAGGEWPAPSVSAACSARGPPPTRRLVGTIGKRRGPVAVAGVVVGQQLDLAA